MVSDRILGWSQQATLQNLPDGGPIWAALLESFARVEAQCAATWEKVTKWVPEILAQHVPEGQVGVFLATLYQLMCTQQQGITCLVVAQAGVPIHLGVHSWAAQVSMTRLFAQVIPGLGSLSGLNPGRANASLGTNTTQPAASAKKVQYTVIPLDGSTMVLASLFPGKQVQSDGSATQPIYLRNDTDSRISGIDPSTLVKAPGGKCQLLASTLKPKPRLLFTAQQQRNELAA